MKETYKASGKANGSTYINYEGLSKREVIKVIRDQVEANRIKGNTVQWTVYRKSDGAAVAAGGMDSTGRRYRLREDYLKDLTGY